MLGMHTAYRIYCYKLHYGKLYNAFLDSAQTKWSKYCRENNNNKKATLLQHNINNTPKEENWCT